MTGCTEYGAEVSAYLDDGLATAERESVERHVETCVSCAAFLRASRALEGKLRALPHLEPSRRFEARLQARLAGVGAVRTPSWRRRETLAGGSVLAAAAAALALVLSSGSSALSDEDWALIADEESFDLMLSDDHELVYALDVLETWDEKEEI